MYQEDGEDDVIFQTAKENLEGTESDDFENPVKQRAGPVMERHVSHTYQLEPSDIIQGGTPFAVKEEEEPGDPHSLQYRGFTTEKKRKGP